MLFMLMMFGACVSSAFKENSKTSTNIVIEQTQLLRPMCEVFTQENNAAVGLKNWN